MGYYTPNQKLACSELYLKIINTFLKNDTCIFFYIVNCPRTHKKHQNLSRPSSAWVIDQNNILTVLIT